jgi:hypothetical protein
VGGGREERLAAKLCATYVTLRVCVCVMFFPWQQDEAECKDKNVFLVVGNMFWDPYVKNMYLRV